MIIRNFNFEFCKEKMNGGEKLMKKLISLVLIYMMFFSSFTCVKASEAEEYVIEGFTINFNGMETGYSTSVIEGKHYLPARKILECRAAFL